MTCNSLLRGLAAATLLLFSATARAELPPLPDTPAPVNALLHLQAFELKTPSVFGGDGSGRSLDSGWILVVEADSDLLLPRQVAMPVLRFGDQAAWKANAGHEDGLVVAIVPAGFEPAKEPLYFGAPGLPEQLDAASGRSDLRTAQAAGLEPLGAAELAAAQEAGGAPLQLEDFTALSLELNELVRRYAGAEAAARGR